MRATTPTAQIKYSKGAKVMGIWSKAEETFIKYISNKFTDGTKGIAEDVLNEIKEVIKEGKQLSDYEKFAENYKNNHDNFDYDFKAVSQFLYDCLNERFYQVYICIDKTEWNNLYNDALAYAKQNNNIELSQEQTDHLKAYCFAFYNKYKSELENSLSPENRTILYRLNYGFNTLNQQLNSLVNTNETISATLDSINAQGQDIQKDVKQAVEKLNLLLANNLKDKESLTQDLVYYTDNGLYYRSYIAPLFLNPNDKKVSLKNTFVLQKYTENNATNDDLKNRLIKFMNDAENKLLLIQGDAGTGKSSLVSWLNYHYTMNDDEIGQKLFNSKKLVTIRLRDLDKPSLEESNSLYDEIFNYTKTENQDNFDKIFPNAVIVLDGYDELCLIENIRNTNLLDELQYFLRTHKVIVTTRPKFANVSNHEKTISIYLEHFDKEKRKQWLDKFKSVCNQAIEPKVEKYITNIDEKNSDGVCDTPMMLYMLCANGKSLADNLDNLWIIFNKVFYNVITETEYNSSLTYKYFHNIYDYKDCIYRVNEEIAYRMYKSGNSKFVLSGQELKEIVRGITNNVTAQEITERSYALCSYWNINTTNGAVEFYHNNIRDFFLCEKIYRELNQLYNNLSDNLSDEEIKQIIDTVCELCAYGNIAEKVLEFIKLRARSDKKQNKSEFPENEHNKKCLPQFFEKMLLDGSIVWKYLKDEKNPIKKMTEIYVNIINIYVFAYQEYLNNEEKIFLYSKNNVDSINKNELFKHIMKCNSNEIHFSNINFDGLK